MSYYSPTRVIDRSEPAVRVVDRAEPAMAVRDLSSPALVVVDSSEGIQPTGQLRGRP